MADVIKNVQLKDESNVVLHPEIDGTCISNLENFITGDNIVKFAPDLTSGTLSANVSIKDSQQLESSTAGLGFANVTEENKNKVLTVNGADEVVWGNPKQLLQDKLVVSLQVGGVQPGDIFSKGVDMEYILRKILCADTTTETRYGILVGSDWYDSWLNHTITPENLWDNSQVYASGGEIKVNATGNVIIYFLVPSEKTTAIPKDGELHTCNEGNWVSEFTHEDIINRDSSSWLGNIDWPFSGESTISMRTNGTNFCVCGLLMPDWDPADKLIINL